MGFRFTWECEYCGTEIVCKKKELPDKCEACNDTGFVLVSPVSLDRIKRK